MSTSHTNTKLNCAFISWDVRKILTIGQIEVDGVTSWISELAVAIGPVTGRPFTWLYNYIGPVIGHVVKRQSDSNPIMGTEPGGEIMQHCAIDLPCLTHSLLTWFELSQAARVGRFLTVCDGCTVPLPGPFDVQVKCVFACELKLMFSLANTNLLASPTCACASMDLHCLIRHLAS